jgi:hypothetical protein
MILEALVAQIEQRFLHEKRARVCLWFDERSEFARLLPLLATHVTSRTTPPFVLLAYDKEQRHGQIWLKHQVHQRLEAAAPADRALLRFVVYVPLAEEHLEAPGRDEEVSLDLLEEFRAVGVFFRIGGKRPTLFSVLKQAGVSLPDGPGDQRRLYDGGSDSLLAKYTAKFVAQPVAFWQTTLTPEVAQSRLIGDVDQTILEIASEPELVWEELQQNELHPEFVAMVRERYGFDAGDRHPCDWLKDFVSAVALTETHAGYGEPKDFPFTDRLPSVGLRENYRQLLQRWLRDSEHRAAWDTWIEEVEESVDLSRWAKGRPGLSFGFPHLVRLRWSEVLAAFEEASPKSTTTSEFFARQGETIEREVEFGKASAHPVGEWELLRELQTLIRACEAGEQDVRGTSSMEGLARVYVKHASNIDMRHLEVRRQAENHGMPSVARVADRAYAGYVNLLNDGFFKLLAAGGRLDLPGVPPVTARLTQAVWSARGRRAVIIVDALRYDCALAVKELLHDHVVDVEPLVAVLPTVTPVGMTALLPVDPSRVTVEVKGNSIHPRVDGKDTSVRENRLALLRAMGADCREIVDIESSTSRPESELLVVFGHDEVDSMGHGQAENLIRHVFLEIDRLVRLVRKLHRWEYNDVHIVTDHGFVLMDESKLPSEVPCNRDWCCVLKERFALVAADADVPLVRLPFPWDPTMMVAVPPGMAFFKAEKSFSHGGAALQELVIPHLTSHAKAATSKPIGVEVVLPTFELSRAAVKVTLRPTRAVGKTNQPSLFGGERGRTLSLDVLRRSADGTQSSVLAGEPKEVALGPDSEPQSVTLFFHTAARFKKGELLDLDIRDVATFEQFPPGGIKLTVGRDM